MHDPNMEYRNTWGEEIRIAEIATWDNQTVEDKASELKQWLQDPELSSRQRAVLEQLVGRVAFELDFRQTELVSLENQLELSN